MIESPIMVCEFTRSDWLKLYKALEKTVTWDTTIGKTIREATPLTEYLDSYCENCDKIDPQDIEPQHNEGYE